MATAETTHSPAAGSAAGAERKVHPIVALDYPIRVGAYLFLGAVFSTVFIAKPTAPWVWVLAAVYFLLWPHVAYRVARNSTNSKRAELRNLLIDGLAGGFFLGLSGYNLLVGLAAFSSINAANFSIGGPRHAARGAVAFAVGMGVGGLTTGFQFDPSATALTIAMSVAGILGFTSIHIPQVIDDLILLARPIIEHNENRLVVQCRVGHGDFQADGPRIKQVLFNLLVNAGRRTHRGQVRLDAQTIDDALVFTVDDTGTGISPEHLAELLRPFTQADAAQAADLGGGSLGLALSRRLCSLMGGEMAAGSQAGQGSSFTVRIPALPLESTADRGSGTEVANG